MNYILGGGSFASQLTQQLREGKGYTYGIFSRFSGTKDPGTFSVFSQVRSNVTLESAQLIKEIIENYGKNYSQQDLITSKSFLIKSNARAFETANAKLGLLNNISKYDWPLDYVKQREQTVKNITVKEVKVLAKKYLDPNKMIWFFVGDAKTQLSRMKALGFGEPILLNPTKVE
jgi:zinc protease